MRTAASERTAGDSKRGPGTHGAVSFRVNENGRGMMGNHG